MLLSAELIFYDWTFWFKSIALVYHKNAWSIWQKNLQMSPFMLRALMLATSYFKILSQTSLQP